MPDPFDRDKLVKLLGLVASDRDPEALSAARKAASMVREHGLEWDDVLVATARRGWRRWFDLAGFLGREVTRRVRAERQARHWHALAELRAREVTRLRTPEGRTDARAGALTAPHEPRPVGQSGHDLVDRLLASPDLDASRRARVEAIAVWLTRTGELTMAEHADLETFARQLGWPR